jgi:glycosyltransferase involved in cell wall biosynthesis
MNPRISVVIRSYNRAAMLCDLLELLLGQRHDSFEIIVVEQSTEVPGAVAKRLERLARDPRVHVHAHPPLGGARARNVGVAAARGELVLLLDDDDQPVGEDFLGAMERAMSDPACLGVTCRHDWPEMGKPSPAYRLLARYRCLHFSTLLKLPLVYVRGDVAVRPVDYVHGTGGMIRRSAYERFGGWDEDTPIEDETSFALRAARDKRPEEYFAFDPSATLRRNLDAHGGLGKRYLAPGAFFGRFMTFVHHILGRYRPWRVRLLYPLYLLAGGVWTASWIWTDSRAHNTVARKVWGVSMFAATMPWHWLRLMRR